jgi:hypothetical protein
MGSEKRFAIYHFSFVICHWEQSESNSKPLVVLVAAEQSQVKWQMINGKW